MNTNRLPTFIKRILSTLTARAIIFTTGAFAAGGTLATADIPDAPSARFGGMYKVASSNDPIFPMQANREWFLDFGKGVTAEKMSGSVAVSLRENPKVKVRIMAWQYFPKQESLIIGNPFSEGSTQAVARGVWKMTPISNGVIFHRENFKVVLRPADPGDY